MKVVGIEFNPAPDAQDRLRRLFTILAGLVEDRPTLPDMDSQKNGEGEGEC